MPGSTPKIFTIPKIFHRVWLSGTPLPQAAQDFIAGWTALHPDWEQRLWTSESLPLLVNQSLFDEAGTFWAKKTDILRYELLRLFGGVYMDVDMEPRKNIDALIQDLDAFAPRFREETSDIFDPDFCLEIAILGTVPHHPLFERLVSSLTPWNAERPGEDVLLATGPHYFTRQVNGWKQGDTGGFSLTELEPKIFQPYEWFEADKQAMDHPDAYGIHQCWGSWAGWNGKPPKK